MLPEGVDLPALITLRRRLHAHPELSGQEEATAATITAFLQDCHPTALWTGLGGHGLAALFDSGQPGPRLLLRAELDALPVAEKPGRSWQSLRTGISHTCGHDGHMTILAGVAQHLSVRPPRRGQVALLFQPAEETGQGAAAVARDPRLTEWHPDRVFALHNLPGYPARLVLIRSGAFCAGSSGLTIQLKGRTSHAAYPEQGQSPDQALAALVTGLVTLPLPFEQEGHLALVTIGHARLGEPAFGITPGEAVILATLRSDDQQVLDRLKTAAETLAHKVSQRHGLELTCCWSDEFPVTANDARAAAEVAEAAARLGLNSTEPDESPFRWSEDFGHLLQLGPGALFGLGAGQAHPPLHAEDFDFNEDLLVPGLALMVGLIDQLRP